MYIPCWCVPVGLAGSCPRCISRSALRSCRSFALKRFCLPPRCKVWPPPPAPSWGAIGARGRTPQVCCCSALLWSDLLRKHGPGPSLLGCFPSVCSQIWTRQLTSRFLRRGRAAGAPAAARSPTRPRAPPSVKATFSRLTDQVRRPRVGGGGQWGATGGRRPVRGHRNHLCWGSVTPESL